MNSIVNQCSALAGQEFELEILAKKGHKWDDLISQVLSSSPIVFAWVRIDPK